jgi:hypothetical protein
VYKIRSSSLCSFLHPPVTSSLTDTSSVYVPPLMSDTKFHTNIEPLEKLYVYDCLGGLVVIVPGYGSRGPGFYSRCYQIFWEVVGLERGPFSLVSTTEELLEKKGVSPV